MKKTLHKQPKLLIKELIKLEKCGKYDEAMLELRHIWEDTTTFPDVEDFEPRVAAEIFLRCGSLIGFLGHNKQLPNAQEKSKNLLTEARQRFLDIYDEEKIAECENYLALAYWRTGEIVEAETWIEETLSHNIPLTNPTRLYSYIVKTMILIAGGKHEENLNLCQKNQKYFNNCDDFFLRGSFHTNFAITLELLHKKFEALKNYELAKRFFRQSEHKGYLGMAENNLACGYKAVNNFTRAHQAVDNAVKIYEKINDKTRKGSSLDTKAQIYLAERKYVEALETIDKSIEILERSENAAYLVESYLTKTKILISLEDSSSATLCLFEAVQVAKAKISEEAAENLVKDFKLEIKRKTSSKISAVLTEKELVNGELELMLPPALVRYKDFQAIQIKNQYLAKIGLTPDSLAIVAKTEVKRGDLVAITEIKDGSVICGFYDADFGIVCIERFDGEPQLLNEGEIKILGKIVGVCESEKRDDGKLHVREIMPSPSDEDFFNY